MRATPSPFFIEMTGTEKMQCYHVHVRDFYLYVWSVAFSEKEAETKGRVWLLFKVSEVQKWKKKMTKIDPRQYICSIFWQIFQLKKNQENNKHQLK